MDFVHYDLGQLTTGQTVEVTLSIAANVLLLDNTNFDAYRTGRRYSYFGGWVMQSPYRIGIPNSGHWHIAVDLGGATGNIRTAARVFG
jgi:hypothetical protein